MTLFTNGAVRSQIIIAFVFKPGSNMKKKQLVWLRADLLARLLIKLIYTFPAHLSLRWNETHERFQVFKKKLSFSLYLHYHGRPTERTISKWKKKAESNLHQWSAQFLQTAKFMLSTCSCLPHCKADSCRKIFW